MIDVSKIKEKKMPSQKSEWPFYIIKVFKSLHPYVKYDSVKVKIVEDDMMKTVFALVFKLGEIQFVVPAIIKNKKLAPLTIFIDNNGNLEVLDENHFNNLAQNANTIGRPIKEKPPTAEKPLPFIPSHSVNGMGIKVGSLKNPEQALQDIEYFIKMDSDLLHDFQTNPKFRQLIKKASNQLMNIIQKKQMQDTNLQDTQQPPMQQEREEDDEMQQARYVKILKTPQPYGEPIYTVEVKTEPKAEPLQKAPGLAKEQVVQLLMYKGVDVSKWNPEKDIDILPIVAGAVAQVTPDVINQYTNLDSPEVSFETRKTASLKEFYEPEILAYERPCVFSGLLGEKNHTTEPFVIEGIYDNGKSGLIQTLWSNKELEFKKVAGLKQIFKSDNTIYIPLHWKLYEVEETKTANDHSIEWYIKKKPNGMFEVEDGYTKEIYDKYGIMEKLASFGVDKNEIKKILGSNLKNMKVKLITIIRGKYSDLGKVPDWQKEWAENTKKYVVKIASKIRSMTYDDRTSFLKLANDLTQYSDIPDLALETLITLAIVGDVDAENLKEKLPEMEEIKQYLLKLLLMSYLGNILINDKLLQEVVFKIDDFIQSVYLA